MLVLRSSGLYAPFERIVTDNLIAYFPLGLQSGNFVDPFGHVVTTTGATWRPNHGLQFDGVNDITDTGSDWIGTGALTLFAMIKPYT